MTADEMMRCPGWLPILWGGGGMGIQQGKGTRVAARGSAEELVSGTRFSLLLSILTKRRQMVNGCGM